MKRRRQVWKFLTALILTSLLLSGLATPLGRSEAVAASDTGIVVEDANSTEEFDLVSSEELSTLASSVAPRVILEYANSVWHQNLTSLPPELLSRLSEVTPRVIIEYANSVWHQNLPSLPAELLSGLSEVTPRVIIEYANSVWHQNLPSLPAELLSRLSEVTPRVIIEYANAIWHQYLVELPTGDTTPPANVTDLAVGETTTNSINLTWTAPGDDGNSGTASEYDIRYSTSQMNESSWASANQCADEPPPQVAGSPETFTVTGLSPNTTYYFALKTADEVPNWSGLSNVVGGTTSPNQPPTCAIQLREHGTTSQIGKVDMWQVFDIYVGGSTDDTGITKVRFSSDDSQDDIPTGEWTGWYDWNTSSDDWNATSKVREWSFATPGIKEVWAEVKDGAGQTNRSCADIKTAYAPNPWGYKFNNNPVLENNPCTFWVNEGLTQDSKLAIFNEVFDAPNMNEEQKKKWVEKEFQGGNCYGMATSSLMEYAYPAYDKFLENQNKATIFELDEPSKGESWFCLWPPWSSYGWDGSGDINSKPVLKHILKFQISQFGDACQNNFVNYSDNLPGFLDDLETNLAEDKMYVMVIIYWDEKYPEGIGHAIIPYAVNKTEGKIYVYDPNHPDSTTYAVEIYEEDGTWKWKYTGFAQAWPPKNAVKSVIGLIPIEKLYNNGEKPRLCGSREGEATFFLDGNTSLLLTDFGGNRTGWINGSYLEEIPGVRPIYIFGALPDGTSSDQQGYYLSNDTKLEATIEGIGNNTTYSITKFGTGYFADVSGVSLQEGAIDNATLFSDGAGLSFSQARQPKTYTLTWNKDVNGTSEICLAVDVPTSPNATHNYTINWTALSQGEKAVTIEIDSDGDGVVDETVFTTPPDEPSNPSPSHNATNISLSTVLGWTGSDPDGDNLTYKVYFGTDEDPPLVSHNQTETSYSPVSLNYGTKYYWRVVARDEYGIATEGPVWQFTTVGATLEGHVSFSGASEGPEWVRGLEARFFNSTTQDEMPWSPMNATTNETGVFTMTGLTPGTYDIGIKNATCLSEVVTSVTLTAGNTTVVDFGETREGDSNNDDIITGADRSLLYSGWGKSEGEGGYNIHYDFNRDGSLGGADRSLMYANWGQHGD